MTFSSKGFFCKCHTYCILRPPLLRSYLKDSYFLILNAVLLAKEQYLPILNIIGLTRPARAELQHIASRMLSESSQSTTTRLPQPVPHSPYLKKIAWTIKFGTRTLCQVEDAYCFSGSNFRVGGTRHALRTHTHTPFFKVENAFCFSRSNFMHTYVDQLFIFLLSICRRDLLVPVHLIEELVVHMEVNGQEIIARFPNFIERD
jgi:hypothetical protein